MEHDAIVIRLDPSARVVERRGDRWSLADPRVLFAMVLDLECRRRVGDPTPRVRVELEHGAEPALRSALARHVPWIEVLSVDAAQESAPLVTAAELAMLFDTSERKPAVGESRA